MHDPDDDNYLDVLREDVYDKDSGSLYGLFTHYNEKEETREVEYVYQLDEYNVINYSEQQGRYQKVSLEGSQMFNVGGTSKRFVEAKDQFGNVMDPSKFEWKNRESEQVISGGELRNICDFEPCKEGTGKVRFWLQPKPQACAYFKDGYELNLIYGQPETGNPNYLGTIPDEINRPEDLPWHNYRDSITIMNIDSSMSNYMPESFAYWFYGFSNIS